MDAPFVVVAEIHVFVGAFLSLVRDFLESLCHLGPQLVNMSVTGSTASRFWHEIMYRALAGKAHTEIRISAMIKRCSIPVLVPP